MNSGGDADQEDRVAGTHENERNMGAVFISDVEAGHLKGEPGRRRRRVVVRMNLPAA